MHNRRPPLPAIILVLALGAAGIYYGIRSMNNNNNEQLTASGTIEAVEVNVSPEVAGKVQEVLVEESQTVKMGDPLLALDDSLLVAQRAVASAQLDAANAGVQTAQNGLATANAQYQTALETALAQAKGTRLQDWFSDPSLFQQPGWYFSRDEQIKAAQAQVDLAQQALEEARTKLAPAAGQDEFLKAEQRLLAARLAYLVAQDVNFRAQNSASQDVPNGLYNRTHCGTNQGYHLDTARLTNLVYKCTGDKQLGDAGATLYNDARDELENAQRAYNALLTSEVANNVLQARANVSVAQERYYSALDFLRKLQTGDQATGVTVAQGVMDQAQAGVEQAQKAVEQAQANLALLDTQLKKLIVYAPMDGAILTRNVEPGEFVQPGAAALTMANLNELTITVYVPEDQYGKISLGQKATVTVDSFPGESFAAEVVHVADQAEFTPRNVQTVEGRSSTVYAIKLKVIDPQAQLKIGMPADVVFK